MDSLCHSLVRGDCVWLLMSEWIEEQLLERNRNAKIVATLGPSSSDLDVIRQLVDAGADVFRFNFSHGSHEDHKRRYDHVRQIENEIGEPICILQDLQGPKVRLGQVAGGSSELVAEQSVVFVLSDKSDSTDEIPFPHKEVFEAILPNHKMLIDDGKIRLTVTGVSDDRIEARVDVGGQISDRKGVNLPNTLLNLVPITEKDQQDLEFGLELGVDYVALSFVQQPSDILEARSLIGNKALIMAKIEKPSAFDRITDIISLSDAIMVARGDLGVEIPPEDVPGKQKELIHACRVAGKPVVIATQMLDSMVNTATPTRAEASDVATAIYDGADAVMLSAESASGAYPVEAVKMMDRIIAKTEAHSAYDALIHSTELGIDSTAQHAISAAAANVASSVGATAILAFTQSGTTAYRISRERPQISTIGLTPNLAVARQLALLWGTRPLQTSPIQTYDEMVEMARQKCLEKGLVKEHDQVIIVAGIPFGERGSTNNLRILSV